LSGCFGKKFVKDGGRRTLESTEWTRLPAISGC
jgi:hypothetical protein